MAIEHGEVFITLDENIIKVKLKGAFNEFGARRYTEGVKSKVNELAGTRFSILVNNLEMLGGTPEAYQELEKYNIWLNSQNLIAKAMVIRSETALELIDLLSPARKLQNNKNFDNEESALSWLRSLC